MDYINGPQHTRFIRQHRQAIIPSYRFNCNQTCGYITEWGVNVRYADLYALDLQVWRPSPTVITSTGTGCYSLVGNNRFTSITPSSRVVLVTPSPQDYIQFQPGDVLGFYAEEAPQRRGGGVVYLTDSISTTVLLASIDPMEAFNRTSYCPDFHYEASPSWRLLQAAPVISISIGSLNSTNINIIAACM